MAEQWQEVFIRNQQTRGIWKAHDEAFVVGELTLSQHAADGDSLLTLANARDLAEDAVDDARDLRDAKAEWLADLCVRFPRAVAGQLAPEDPMHNEVADVQGIEINSQADLADRGRKVVSLVTRYNAARAAAVPPKPALTLKPSNPDDDDVTIGAFTTELNAQSGRLLAIEDRKADFNKARSALQKHTLKVDRNNKRWFIAWEGNFPDGSPEIAALSQIDTGPSTPAPGAKEIDQATALGSGAVRITPAAGVAAHASLLMLQWRIVGVDTEFVHAAVVVLAGQTITGLPVGATVEFKIRASNSKGHTDGAVKSVVVA